MVAGARLTVPVGILAASPEARALREAVIEMSDVTKKKKKGDFYIFVSRHDTCMCVCVYVLEEDICVTVFYEKKRQVTDKM